MNDQAAKIGSERVPGSWLYVVCIAILFLVGVFAYFNYTEDDAGISFRYGENLFQGKGLVYNDGERVEGYSNFGFVVLVGLLGRLIRFIPEHRYFLIFVVKLINILAGGLTLFLSYHFSRKILDRDSATSWLTVLLVAANGAFVIHTACPMETATYGALLMSTAYSLAWNAKSGNPLQGRRFFGLLGLLGILSVWRIDAPVLVGAMGLGILVHFRGRLPRAWQKLGLTWLALYTGYTVFRLLYFGDIVNNPFYAKVAPGIGDRIGLLYNNIYFHVLGGGPLFLSILVLLGGLIDWRKSAIPVTLLVCQWCFIVTVNGDWMTGFRFWAALTPYLCFTLVAVIESVISFQQDNIIRHAAKPLLLLVIVIYWFMAGNQMYQLDRRTWFTFPGKGGKAAILRLNPYWPTARWLTKHVEPGTRIVVQEGGFIPFLTGLPAIDSYGLCDKTLSRVEGKRGRIGLIPAWTRNDPATAYILSRKPDYLVLGPLVNEPPQTFLDEFILVARPEYGMFIYRRAERQETDIFKDPGTGKR